MRTIKFRAWNGKKMFQSEDLSIAPRYRKWLGKVDVILMQFTGLLDKNGKEIYEGDILKFFNHIWKVEWDKRGGWAQTTEPPMNKEEISRLAHFVDNDMNVKEVIGNIWENPELLK